MRQADVSARRETKDAALSARLVLAASFGTLARLRSTPRIVSACARADKRAILTAM
ncbi:protein of unknown function [Caballeronia sp. S22]